MARTVYYVASSLDGFIADPQDNLDWLMQFNDQDGVQDTYRDFIANVGAIVMGSSTYQFLLNVGGWEYGLTPAWVFTHQEMPVFPVADFTFVRGDFGLYQQSIRADAGGKDVWVVGGGALAGQDLGAGMLGGKIPTPVPG